MKREDVLNAAKQCVCQDRNDQYGDPEDNFKTIAGLWSWYLHSAKDNQTIIYPHDVANMMVLLKMARAASGKLNPDNYIDAAGYAACAAELQGKGCDS